MEELFKDPLEDYTTIFKALSDKTRLKILWLLNSIDSKICVSEIIDIVNENQYNVSRHLKVLKNAGLIREKKEGKWVYYFLLPANDSFRVIIQEAIKSIPKELLELEIEKCKKNLLLREDEK